MSESHKRLLVRLVRDELRRSKERPQVAEKLRELRVVVESLGVTDHRERVLLAEVVRWYGERGQTEAKKFAKIDPQKKFEDALDEAARFLES